MITKQVVPSPSFLPPSFLPPSLSPSLFCCLGALPLTTFPAFVLSLAQEILFLWTTFRKAFLPVAHVGWRRKPTVSKLKKHTHACACVYTRARLCLHMCESVLACVYRSEHICPRWMVFGNLLSPPWDWLLGCHWAVVVWWQFKPALGSGWWKLEHVLEPSVFVKGVCWEGMLFSPHIRLQLVLNHRTLNRPECSGYGHPVRWPHPES